MERERLFLNLCFWSTRSRSDLLSYKKPGFATAQLAFPGVSCSLLSVTLHWSKRRFNFYPILKDRNSACLIETLNDSKCF